MLKSVLKLCLVTTPNQTPLVEYLQFIQHAIKGGVTCVQFRDKTNSISRVRNTVLALKNVLDAANIPLIINDYVEVAKEIDAFGVHLGQPDMPPQEARAILGKDKIIGWSIESLVQLEIANQLDCIDYVAASSVFVSKNKKNCRTIWGLDGLQQFAQLSKHPVIAIGGINASNVREVVKHGACGIAVISAIHDDTQPFNAAQELIAIINDEEENAAGD